MTARPRMVLGTSAHVGKSLTVAALCRIFARAGYRVAPFSAEMASRSEMVLLSVPKRAGMEPPETPPRQSIQGRVVSCFSR
jgi:CobQ/CobB/MinD/ParA nucleotide binding domain